MLIVNIAFYEFSFMDPIFSLFSYPGKVVRGLNRWKLFLFNKFLLNVTERN